MSPIRRNLLAAAGPAMASASMLNAGPGLATAHASVSDGHEVRSLARRAEQAHEALMQGDLSRYRKAISIAGDFTLMAPFGGTPTRGVDLSEERWTAIARFFRNGRDSSLELIHGYSVEDMVVLAAIERTHAGVGGLPEQGWALRVTLVFRKDPSGWALVHRHADPLVAGISLEQAAGLAIERRAA